MGGPYLDENGHLQRPQSSGKDVGDDFVMAPAPKPTMDFQGSRKSQKTHDPGIVVTDNAFSSNGSSSNESNREEVACNELSEVAGNKVAELVSNIQTGIHEEPMEHTTLPDQTVQVGQPVQTEKKWRDRPRKDKSSIRKHPQQPKPAKSIPPPPPPPPPPCQAAADEIPTPLSVVAAPSARIPAPEGHCQSQAIQSRAEHVIVEQPEAAGQSFEQSHTMHTRLPSRGQPYVEQRQQQPQQPKQTEVGYKDLFNLVPLLVDQEVQHRKMEHQAKIEASKARNRTLWDNCKNLEQQLAQANLQIVNQEKHLEKEASRMKDLQIKCREFEKYMEGIGSDINVLKQDFRSVKDGWIATGDENFPRSFKATNENISKRVLEIESTYSRVIREHEAVNRDLLARLQMAEEHQNDLQLRLDNSVSMLAEERARNHAFESKIDKIADHNNELHTNFDQNHQRSLESLMNVRQVISTLLEDTDGDSMLLSFQKMLESAAEHQESTRDALKGLEYKVAGIDTSLTRRFEDTTNYLTRVLDSDGHLAAQIQSQVKDLQVSVMREADLSDRVVELELENRDLSIDLKGESAVVSQLGDRLNTKEQELNGANEEISRLKDRLKAEEAKLQDQELELDKKLEEFKKREEATKTRADTAEMAMRAAEGRAKSLQEQVGQLKIPASLPENVFVPASSRDCLTGNHTGNCASITSSPPQTPSADKQMPINLSKKPQPTTIQNRSQGKGDSRSSSGTSRVLRPRGLLPSNQEAQKATVTKDMKKGVFKNNLDDPFSGSSVDALAPSECLAKGRKRQRAPNTKPNTPTMKKQRISAGAPK